MSAQFSGRRPGSGPPSKLGHGFCEIKDFIEDGGQERFEFKGGLQLAFFSTIDCSLSNQSSVGRF